MILIKDKKECESNMYDMHVSSLPMSRKSEYGLYLLNLKPREVLEANKANSV